MQLMTHKYMKLQERNVMKHHGESRKQSTREEIVVIIKNVKTVMHLAKTASIWSLLGTVERHWKKNI